MNNTKNSFCAIGVGQGDAFFFNNGEQTMLIDGGRSMQSLPHQFKRVTELDGVDILVCTHNDADHARGILGFLNSELQCKEIWLPGSWADRLEDLINIPQEFMNELIKNIEDFRFEEEFDDIQFHSTENYLLELLGDKYAMKETNKDENPSDDNGSELLFNEIEIAERNIFEEFFGLSQSSFGSIHLAQYPFFDILFQFRGDQRKYRLFIESISASTLIREIALIAFHKGLKIRWFEFNNHSNSGGIQGSLIPLNANEICRMRRKRLPVLKYLALTTSNKQSLVFMSSSNAESPPILFSADSDLSFNQEIPWQDGMIITVPHHGSVSNNNAYKRFDAYTNGVFTEAIWVRSDGCFKKRPCSSYLSITTPRYCTLCRESKYPKQDVSMILKSNKWQPESSNIRPCNCV